MTVLFRGLLLGLLLSGCQADPADGAAALTQSAASVFAECDAAEIRFLTGKHGIQTAFESCGHNAITSMRWSPGGRWLYFQLAHGGMVLDGEGKTLAALPTESPAAGAAWLREDLLAIPLAPLPEAPAGARIVLYNRAANTLDEVALPLAAPRDLQPGADPAWLLLTGLDGAGQRQVVSIDTATGAATPAFPWLTAVDAETGRVDFSPAAGLVGVGGADAAALYRADGTVVARLPGARRVVPHPGGRYVALEVDGAPVSPFDMRAWDELPEAERQRELARREEWLAGQPDWVPREIVPPELQILDLKLGVRYRVTAFWGEAFQWYEARDTYASFLLFGVEGKQLNRNVALVDLRERLQLLEAGGEAPGFERLETQDPAAAPDEAPAPG